MRERRPAADEKQCVDTTGKVINTLLLGLVAGLIVVGLCGGFVWFYSQALRDL